MAGKWYKYTVSQLVEDMLRYDVAYVLKEKPEKTELFPGCEVYRGEVTLYSEYPPTNDRWASFGVKVTNVSRVPRPKDKLWGVARGENYTLKWIFLAPQH